jgi:hypothetical protein
MTRDEMRAEMTKLVDQALSFVENSREVDSFLAAFVLMYDRWVTEKEPKVR